MLRLGGCRQSLHKMACVGTPVGHDAAAVQAAQDLGGGGHQDAARRLQVDHVRRRVDDPQRPAGAGEIIMITGLLKS